MACAGERCAAKPEIHLAALPEETVIVDLEGPDARAPLESGYLRHDGHATDRVLSHLGL